MEEQIVRLIAEYQKKRAKYYRRWQKAYRQKDECTQIVAAALQLAYTEMQVDLEKVLELPNEKQKRKRA